MKKYFLPILAVVIIGAIYAFNKFSVQDSNDPWTEKQLMNPADLAKMLNDSSAKLPYIYSIGFGGGIKKSIEFGPAEDKANLEKFKTEISKLSKDADIVIYCGCCPFKNCPNVRPAFNLLKEMKFTNYKLLNLSNNLKTDWLDKGYPITETK